MACDPNTTGKETVEDIVIEDINKTAMVTYVPRKDLTGIKLITLAECKYLCCLTDLTSFFRLRQSVFSKGRVFGREILLVGRTSIRKTLLVETEGRRQMIGSIRIQDLKKT